MFCCFVFRGCRGKACPSESACTYDIAACGGADWPLRGSRQCHKYYGLVVAQPRLKRRQSRLLRFATAKRMAPDREQKKAAPDTAYKNVVSGAAVVIGATCVQALTFRNCPR